MRKTMILLSALLAVPGLAQGPVGTAARGSYSCELPGNAAGAAGIAQPEANFRIASASRYQSAQGDGTYLRQGDTIRFTSGPRKGELPSPPGPGWQADPAAVRPPRRVRPVVRSCRMNTPADLP